MLGSKQEHPESTVCQVNTTKVTRCNNKMYLNVVAREAHYSYTGILASWQLIKLYQVNHLSQTSETSGILPGLNYFSPLSSLEELVDTPADTSVYQFCFAGCMQSSLVHGVDKKIRQADRSKSLHVYP